MGVALLALFVSLGGVSYGVATGSIDSREIKNNTVRGKDVRNNSIRGADILESKLAKVPSAVSADTAATAGSATNAESATNATNAANADALDGIDSAALLKSGDAAGGALSGTYPNPSLADGAVTASKLGTLTERNSTVAAVTAGQSALFIAQCLPGERVIGGGGAWQTPSNTDHLQIVHSLPSLSSNDWRVRAFNGTGAAENFFATALCLAG
jgi:hypothetical protein